MQMRNKSVFHRKAKIINQPSKSKQSAVTQQDTETGLPQVRHFWSETRRPARVNPDFSTGKR